MTGLGSPPYVEWAPACCSASRDIASLATPTSFTICRLPDLPKRMAALAACGNPLIAFSVSIVVSAASDVAVRKEFPR